MRTFKIVLFIFIGLVLVAVAAVAALIFVDPSVYRNQLETRASKAFNRQFNIHGPIHLERSLRPRIIVEDITIGNPDWATDPHFATAEKVGLRVALFPLLRGDLRVLNVSFSGVNLFIEKGFDGANNYTFGDRGEGQTPGVLPPIERLLVKDTVINYQTADGSSSRFEISEARLWNIPGEPERIEAQGTVRPSKSVVPEAEHRRARYVTDHRRAHGSSIQMATGQLPHQDQRPAGGFFRKPLWRGISNRRTF